MLSITSHPTNLVPSDELFQSPASRGTNCFYKFLYLCIYYDK